MSVRLTISPAAFDEIARVLRSAGLGHRLASTPLDMDEVALVRGTEGPESFKFDVGVIDPKLSGAATFVPHWIETTCKAFALRYPVTA